MNNLTGKKCFGVTLLEVIIVMTLFAVLILGFSSIDTFVRFQVRNGVRRSQIQNRVSFILTHMQKHISSAIGNETLDGAGSVVNITDTTYDSIIAVYIDFNNDGLWQAGIDSIIGYRYNIATNQVFFCDSCSSAVCDVGDCLNWESLGNQVTDFLRTANSPLDSNFVTIRLTACWDPSDLTTCGTMDNPDMIMESRIQMPSVSTN